MSTSATPPGIACEKDGPVARITLNRPARHNALEADDVQRMLTLLDEVSADDAVRVLVLTGTGERTFCSGASLDQMQSGEMSGELFDTLTDRLAAVPVPTVAAINGSVYGGGGELALCCDVRVGVEGMRLSVPAARLGVCYPVGGLTRYVRRLGLTSASRVLLCAEELEAAELLRIGYLTHLVSRRAFDTEVAGLCERLAGLAPLAVKAMKRIMLEVVDGTLDREAAERLVAACSGSADLQEGLAAWRERRPPVFEGR